MIQSTQGYIPRYIISQAKIVVSISVILLIHCKFV